MNNDVILVIQYYNIIQKDSTKIIQKTIEECKQIFWAWKTLSKQAQNKTAKIFNDEILKKLQKCYKYYHNAYDVKIETGYSTKKDIEINISNICEKIKSWEDDYEPIFNDDSDVQINGYYE